MRTRLCTALPQSQKPPSTPHPCSEDYEGGDFFGDFHAHLSGRYTVGASLVRGDLMRCWSIGVLAIILCAVTNCRYRPRKKGSLGLHYGNFFPHL
jgi:hypothetical protein